MSIQYAKPRYGPLCLLNVSTALKGTHNYIFISAILCVPTSGLGHLGTLSVSSAQANILMDFKNTSLISSIFLAIFTSQGLILYRQKMPLTRLPGYADNLSCAFFCFAFTCFLIIWNIYNLECTYHDQHCLNHQ